MKNAAVVVTGASTGIGHATAMRLAREGYAVFAGVRKPADAQRIAAENTAIIPLQLDVCAAHDIDAAADQVRAHGVPLAGLVNNAGVVVAGPLEYLPIDRLREQFEVNFFGAFAVTQAMLPMLRDNRGRIVFVSSVSGQIAPPFLGPYASSKFALEAACDSLRMELSDSGVLVSVVQPGNVKTPIWQKGRERKDEMLASLPPQALLHYGAYLEKLVELTEREERTGIPADDVAHAICRALTDAAPRARYPVGVPAGWQRKMAALLPERLRDRLVLKNFR